MSELTGSPPESNKVLSLKAIAARTGDLPTMPITSVKALRMTNDPNTSAGELQRVIIQDQALTARVLRIVNSALYCLSREVSTISHAVALLGMETIRSIILAATVQNVLRSGFAHSRDLGSKLLTEHSWGAALAARILAQKTRYGNAEEAFLAGLMHDLGKPVLMTNIPDRYNPILNDVYRGTATFHQAEMQAFGFSHQHVGAILAEKWKFPPQLAEAIGYHHTPMSAPDHTKLACIVGIANLLMVALEIGFEKDKELEVEAHPAAAYLELTRADLDAIAEEVREALAQTPDPLKY
jgi:putative nucleotidyltransferase with HDIG domain